MTLDEFKALAPGYVATGAEWLDANEPGWEGRIDLGDLDLADSCRCVLGQVMPEQSYTDALVRLQGLDGWFALDVESPGGAAAHAWAVGHGFNAPLDDDQFGNLAVLYDAFPVLDELWIALVKLRHDSGTLSG